MLLHHRIRLEPRGHGLARLAIDAEGGMLPAPGQQVDLAEQDGAGRFRRSIVKVTNPGRHGIVVGDFFV